MAQPVTHPASWPTPRPEPAAEARRADHPAPSIDEIVRCARKAPAAPGPPGWTLTESSEGELDLRASDIGGVPTRPGRAPVVAAGAALLHLRVAARAAGASPSVHVVPTPSDPWLVARIALDPGWPAPPELLRLRAAIDGPAGDVAPTGELLAALEDAAALEGAWFEVLGRPVHARPAWDAASRHRADGRVVAVIGTLGDGVVDWLVGGQAFGRVVLCARSEGVPVAPVGSHDGLRGRPALAVLGRPGVTQVVVEIGPQRVD